MDEDSPGRRGPFGRESIAIHQRREMVRHWSSTWSLAPVSGELAGLPRGQRPRPRGSKLETQAALCPARAKRACSVGDSCQGLQGGGGADLNALKDRKSR
jgi:hypothetical protein